MRISCKKAGRKSVDGKKIFWCSARDKPCPHQFWCACKGWRELRESALRCSYAKEENT